MIEFYNFNDEVILKYETLPDLDNRGDTNGFYDDEKKYIDTVTTVEVTNPNYIQSKSENKKIDSLGIRKRRDAILKHSDATQFRDALNSSGNLLTTTQQTTIDAWRQVLRDLPDAIITNGFTDLAFPTVPTCLPSWIKSRCDVLSVS